MTAAAAPASAGAQGTFSPRVVLALLMVGVVAFGAFLVLSTYAPEMRSGDDGRAHALSHSAIGYQGLVGMLRDGGVGVTVARSAPAPDSQALWVLTPDSDDGLQDALRNRRGPTLIVLPKWNAPPSATHRGWVGPGQVRDVNATGGVLKDVDTRVGVAQASNAPVVTTFQGVGAVFRNDVALATGPIGSLRTLTVATGENAPTMELADASGRALLVRLQGPHANVYVLSDPDLLNNLGLADLRTATAADTVIRRLSNGHGVILDVSLAGFERGRGLLRTAFEPPFLAATLCFIAAALLMGLHAAARFGPQARAGRVFALGKTALAENAAGLIALAGREARLLPAYATDVRTAVARDIGAPRDLDETALNAFLDRIGRSLNASELWSTLNADARDASDPLAVARRLHRWRGEMTRGRR